MDSLMLNKEEGGSGKRRETKRVFSHPGLSSQVIKWRAGLIPRSYEFNVLAPPIYHPNRNIPTAVAVAVAVAVTVPLTKKQAAHRGSTGCWLIGKFFSADPRRRTYTLVIAMSAVADPC